MFMIVFDCFKLWFGVMWITYVGRLPRSAHLYH